MSPGTIQGAKNKTTTDTIKTHTKLAINQETKLLLTWFETLSKTNAPTKTIGKESKAIKSETKKTRTRPSTNWAANSAVESASSGGKGPICETWLAFQTGNKKAKVNITKKTTKLAANAL